MQGTTRGTSGPHTMRRTYDTSPASQRQSHVESGNYPPQLVLDAQGHVWLGTGGAVVPMSGTVALIPYGGDAPVNPS